MAGASTAIIGKGLNGLPWQLFVPIIFCLSIGCIYCAVTIKIKSKKASVICYFAAIMGFIMVVESLAKNTGILVQCLPFVEPIGWILFFIAMIFLFFFT